MEEPLPKLALSALLKQSILYLKTYKINYMSNFKAHEAQKLEHTMI